MGAGKGGLAVIGSDSGRAPVRRGDQRYLCTFDANGLLFLSLLATGSGGWWGGVVRPVQSMATAR